MPNLRQTSTNEGAQPSTAVGVAPAYSGKGDSEYEDRSALSPMAIFDVERDADPGEAELRRFEVLQDRLDDAFETFERWKADADAQRRGLADLVVRLEARATAWAQPPDPVPSTRSRLSRLRRGRSASQVPDWIVDEHWYSTQVGTTVAHDAVAADYLARRPDEMVSVHPLFDAAHYARHRAGGAPSTPLVVEFLTADPALLVDPHPLFSLNHYYSQRPDVATARMNPLEHYLRHGGAEGVTPHALFDPEWYASQHPDLGSYRTAPLAHYLATPEGRLSSPHPLFDTVFYLARSLSAQEALERGVAPLVYYVTHADQWAIPTHPLLDPVYYLEHYDDVVGGPLDPLSHYLLIGRFEHRRLANNHDVAWYAAEYMPGSDPKPLDALLDYARRASTVGLDRAKRDLNADLLARKDAFLASDARIVFTPSAQAQVTVVILVWNKSHFTLECLRTLAEAYPEARVVVVDQDSTDDTSRVLDRVDGITTLHNATNTGFVDGVNQGVAGVETPFTLLLNNDAFVRPGSIEQALSAASDATVGAVGARIVLPNGLLQEAGSFLWHDGSAQGYLRGRRFNEARALRQRDVDFCSGAFLLVRTSIGDSLGWLAEVFRPAYFEEVDLCLRIGEAGYRVLYHPLVIVDHVEFGSSTASSAAIAAQRERRAILAERHAELLSDRPAPGTASATTMANWPLEPSSGVVVVDDRLPSAIEGSGFPRAVEFADGLLHSDRSTIIWAATSQRPKSGWYQALAALDYRVDALLDLEPYLFETLFTEHRDRFDTIIVSRRHNYDRFREFATRNPDMVEGVRVIYDSEAITSVREDLQSQVLGHPWSRARARTRIRAELSLAASADTVIAVSPAERDLFVYGGARDVPLISYGVDRLATPTTPPDSNRVLFVGRACEDDSPNSDSLRWFVTECLPQIRRDHSIEFVVAGMISRSMATLVESAGGTALGPVDDLASVFDRARVFVAPTRFAAGIPLKVLTAASYGVPVVATPLLADQLRWRDGHEIASGATPAGFAAAVVRLLVDDEAWMRHSRGASARLSRDYSQEHFRSAVRELLNRQ